MMQGQPIYILSDWYNKPVKGTFYQKELQKIEVRDDDMFKVEKVIKYKGRGNKREALVQEQVYKVDHFQHIFLNVFSWNIPEKYSVEIFGTIILNNNSIYILKL